MTRYDQAKVYAADWKPLIELMTARKKFTAQAAPNRAQRRAKKGK
jgi:hypothetical protein